MVMLRWYQICRSGIYVVKCKFMLSRVMITLSALYLRGQRYVDYSTVAYIIFSFDILSSATILILFYFSKPFLPVLHELYSVFYFGFRIPKLLLVLMTLPSRCGILDMVIYGFILLIFLFPSIPWLYALELSCMCLVSILHMMHSCR